MKNQVSKQSSSAFLFDRSTKCLLPAADCHPNTARDPGQNQDLSRITSKIKVGFNVTKSILDHMRLAPKLTETVKGKLRMGARILRVGGVEKVFKKLFSFGDGEKLLKASQCYLSTTAGPIAGLLFISTEKVAFCSERSIKIISPAGKLLKIYYKVSIPARKIKGANACETVKDASSSSHKYIQVVTDDNFEFWFMGFLNHQKTLNYLQLVLDELQ